MDFTFGESVKLAAKGYKPNDIAELKLLDENKFSKEDILSLISNGYTKSEVKKLVETFSTGSDDKPDEKNDDSDEKDDHKKEPEKKSEQDDPGSDDSDDKDDKIDYKELYEKEKKLREELQHKNAAAGSSDNTDKRTPEQIAIDIAESII